MSVKLNAHGLEIDGQFVPVYSGTVHYWRLERSAWPKILDQVKVLGFGMIETYLPWSVHETSPGHYDWGQADPRKDAEAFMRLCEEKGLWLLVRPGPLINAELTDFGFPDWVLMDPDVQSRTAVGGIHYDAASGLHPPHQFPVPSYASEKFFQYAGGWYDAIGAIMVRHLAPQGCIVAVQSDNETCYLFHDQPYATDYGADSIALYRRCLREKYVSLDTLNAAYSAHYTDFSQVEPPRDCEVETRADVPRHVDWVAYKEYQIRWSVARFARMLRERGVQGIPIFHDIAYQYATPLDVARMEADPDIDWVGMNLYRNQEDYSGAVQRIRFLAGSTRLPFVPEFGNGLWSHHPQTFTPAEEEFITLGALMHGLKAINFYMLVERERWQGCPITRHGTLRPEYARFYQRLSDFLQRYPAWQYERERQVLILLNFDLGRFAALATTLNYSHADLLGLPRELFEVDLDLGLKFDPQVEANLRRPDSWLGTLFQQLALRHLDYDLGDSHIDPARLARYPIVFLQTTDFMDADDQRCLMEYVQRGGHLVVGPGMPYLDPALKPASVFGQVIQSPGTVAIGNGHFTWVETHKLAAMADDWLPCAEYPCDQPLVDLAVLRRNDVTLLFLANPTAQPLDATVTFESARALRAAWGEAATLSAAPSHTFTLNAYSIQIWEIDHD